MFSYRHAFHAGNHGDVLKHACLIAALRHLMKKPGPLRLVDTHAGAGAYRLSGAMARKSAEADAGIRLLQDHVDRSGTSPPSLLGDYLEAVAAVSARYGNSGGVYPGSPLLMHELLCAAMRRGDRLHLFEWHPTVAGLLQQAVRTWPCHKQLRVVHGDGFAGLKGLLPPPAGVGGSRRAFVLIDPSYELKTDYEQVVACTTDGLRRFATGVFMIWYPMVDRPQARGLPARLRAVAQTSGRDWLDVRLHVRNTHALAHGAQGGMPGSGVFLINPPYVLAGQLRDALPALSRALGQDAGSKSRGWQLKAGST